MEKSTRGGSGAEITEKQPGGGRQKIAVVGSGISGLSAAWLLREAHDVTVFERSPRVGGHSNTVVVAATDGSLAIDTGFIVYNSSAYPNLAALFRHLDVPTQPTEMSLGVSLRGGALEYSGTTLSGLFAQPSNVTKLRFWRMLRDIARFYREAPADARVLSNSVTLGDYLERNRYDPAFADDHLLPMAAAIWSAPASQMLDYPIAAFVRFCENHGLLLMRGRPVWRTVTGGSATYVTKLTRTFADRVHIGRGAGSISRPAGGGVTIRDTSGATERFDHVVLACHADEALALIEDATPEERRILSAFRYARNEAVLHSDGNLMPKRRNVWSSWNYLGTQDALCVTYWMNRLQSLPGDTPYFVTLNPVTPPSSSLMHHTEVYTHPVFDPGALAAQKELWSLQGVRDTWFCGAYFGSGFHEDGLQAGLAVAEQLGGVRRPWTLPDPSGRIAVSLRPQRVADLACKEASA